MRVSKGHDVPADKLVSRYPRMLMNLRRAIKRLPHVVVCDDSDLATPVTKLGVVEMFEGGSGAELAKPMAK